jgi:hypothetical protein
MGRAGSPNPPGADGSESRPYLVSLPGVPTKISVLEMKTIEYLFKEILSLI